MFTPSGCKDIGIRMFDSVVKTPFSNDWIFWEFPQPLGFWEIPQIAKHFRKIQD